MQVNRDYLRAKGGFLYRDPLANDGIEAGDVGGSVVFGFGGDAIKTGAGWVDAGKGLPILASNGVYRQFIKPLTLIAITQKLPEGSGGAAALNLRTGRDPDRSILFPVLFTVLVLSGLAACSNEPKLPKPPFETPVNLSHKGVVADFDIRVPKHRIYHFELSFEYPEEDRAERERVRKIVGSLHEATLVSTPVKLTIFKEQVQNKKIIYQIIIEDPDTYSASSNDFGKKLGHCDLKRGKYRFVLESLAQPQEYASIPTKFAITFPNIFKFSTNLKGIDRSKTCPQ